MSWSTARVSRWAVLASLLLLSVLALLPWDPLGPFDARDYSLLPDMRIDYPSAAAVLEPLIAPGHILMGAPDFRLAFISTAVWLAVLAAVWGWLRGGAWWRRLLRASGWAISAVWCLAAYLLFVSHVHFPGWRLVTSNPDSVVADLQSHTLGSHDGLVRAPVNLSWHDARGYDVTAITEHDDPGGSFYTQRLAAQNFPHLGVIAGAEVGSEYGGFLLAMGLQEGLAIPSFWDDRTDYARRFIDTVHNDHGGAVISMAWRLDAAAVRQLAASGVDAFEITNNGHPDIPAEVRANMLELARTGQVVLVSSTDWHGWGGFSRTWTVFDIPGASGMDAQQRAAAVVRLLRERNGAAITPVVAGYLGPPSTLRLILTPAVELMRYAAELSAPRVIAWWLWSGVLLLGGYQLARRGLRPWRVLLLSWLGVVGSALLWRGMQLYFTLAQGDVVRSDVTGELGGMAMYVGAPLLTAASVLAVQEWRHALGRTERA